MSNLRAAEGKSGELASSFPPFPKLPFPRLLTQAGTEVLLV